MALAADLRVTGILKACAAFVREVVKVIECFPGRCDKPYESRSVLCKVEDLGRKAKAKLNVVTKTRMLDTGGSSGKSRRETRHGRK